MRLKEYQDRSVDRCCSMVGCDAPIGGCFGYVIAGDALKAYEGALPWTHVREICGKCGEEFYDDRGRV
jgi:hypothetical protein